MCFFFFSILFIFFSIRVYHKILNTVPCVIQWDLAVSVQFSLSVVSDSFQPHGLQYTKLPCSSQTPGTCSNSCPSSQWCHPTISSIFSSCPQSFPASGSFPKNQFFTSGGQSIGVSASAPVLPMNIQDWFPLAWTGLISCCLSILYIIVCTWVLNCFSFVRLCATLRTVVHWALLSTGVSRQEYWSRLQCPPLGDLPDPGIKPESLTSPALAGRFFTASTTWEASLHLLISNCQSFSNPQPSLVDVCFLIQVKSWAVEELHFST